MGSTAVTLYSKISFSTTSIRKDAYAATVAAVLLVKLAGMVLNCSGMLLCGGAKGEATLALLRTSFVSRDCTHGLAIRLLLRLLGGRLYLVSSEN